MAMLHAAESLKVKWKLKWLDQWTPDLKCALQFWNLCASSIHSRSPFISHDGDTGFKPEIRGSTV